MSPTPVNGSGQYDDKTLVTIFLKDRGEDVFREIYRRHAPAVNRLVVRLVGAKNGDAEDIVQSMWIRAVEGLDRFRWESTLKTWLTGIAINCAREYFRKKSRSRDTFWADTDDFSAGAPLVPREVHRVDLERAIADLPNGYREVLVLHDVEGYTHEEIGRFLGIESGTSKSQLSRARRAVRTLLGGNGYGYGSKQQ